MDNNSASVELTPNWIPDTANFAARLALVRWHMGWNLAEAERECGLSQNTWGNWEAGAMPRNFIEAVSKIVWRTKVNRYWLIDGQGSPDSPDDDTMDYGGNVTDISTGKALLSGV